MNKKSCFHPRQWQVIGLLSAFFLIQTQTAFSQMTEGDFFGKEIELHRWKNFDHERNGFDWSMPDWVKPAPHSAVVKTRKIDGISADEKLLAKGYRGNFKRRLDFTWRDFEPEEGVYNVEGLKRAIDKVSENGKYKIEFRFLAAGWEYDGYQDDGSPLPQNRLDRIRAREESAPKWLGSQYPIQQIKHNIHPSFELINLDEYSPYYHSRYLKAIEKLGETGIFADPRVLNAYVHLGSPTRGEEGVGPKLGTAERKIYEERLRAWADAAGKYVNKLMNPSTRDADVELAIDLGMGHRGGQVEYYLKHIYEPLIGMNVTKDGYLEVDENVPLIKEKRASGDENEAYFFNSITQYRFGDRKAYKHGYRESMLRVLQMRRTTIWDEGTAAFIDPALSEFVSLSLGKDVYSTADAWVYLRQSNLAPNNPHTNYPMNPEAYNDDGTKPLKNFERWLYQRDSQSIKTLPALKSGHGGKQIFRDRRHPYDFIARKTQRYKGYNKIGFALDDRFIKGTGEVAVKVTYLDEGNVKWALKYTNENGCPVKLVHTNSNSGELKTKTWILKDISFNATGMNNDFFLVSLLGDLTASFVRVVKLQENQTQNKY